MRQDADHRRQRPRDVVEASCERRLVGADHRIEPPFLGLLGRACERPPRILGGQKNLDGAIGAARLNAADQGFLAGIFIGVGETLAVAGDEI